MENLENSSSIICQDEQLSLFKFKENQGFNETNLMTLPFIWLKRLDKKNPKRTFTRTWTKSNNETVSIKVVGGECGVPCIGELDILLALFKIYINQIGNKVTINKESKLANFPTKKIHFTYRQLAKVMGYKSYGGALKKKLERSILTLNETTIYSNFAVKDATTGEYVDVFKCKKSSRIIESYIGYSKESYIKKNGESLKASEIKDYQVIELDDFFFDNICNSYFKVYNYDDYIKLKYGVSKKLYLILSTWSKQSSKTIRYETLYDYIGLEYETKSDIKYNKDQIRKAIKELVEIGFIEDYKIKSGKNGGVEFIFNSYKTELKFFKDKYNTNGEIVEKLRLINISYDEINELFKAYDGKTMAGLLRYMDYREENGNTIANRRRYFLTGLKRKYNIKAFV